MNMMQLAVANILGLHVKPIPPDTWPCRICGKLGPVSIFGHKVNGHRHTHCAECRAEAAKPKKEKYIPHFGKLDFPERECAHCKIRYKPKSANQKACSQRCYDKIVLARRKVERKVASEIKRIKCAHCGVSFKPSSGVQLYCTTSCKSRRARAIRKLADMNADRVVRARANAKVTGSPAASSPERPA